MDTQEASLKDQYTLIEQSVYTLIEQSRAL